MSRKPKKLPTDVELAISLSVGALARLSVRLAKLDSPEPAAEAFRIMLQLSRLIPDREPANTEPDYDAPTAAEREERETKDWRAKQPRRSR